jgi:hypothetical protein
MYFYKPLSRVIVQQCIIYHMFPLDYPVFC